MLQGLNETEFTSQTSIFDKEINFNIDLIYKRNNFSLSQTISFF